MIYRLLDRSDEEKKLFEKYKELPPKKFEVDGFLKPLLSRMELFGSERAASKKISKKS